MSRILVVDDDAAAARLLTEVLTREGYEVTTALSVADAVKALEDGARFDATLTDLRMPGASGLDLVAELRKRDPAAIVLVLTAFGNAQAAAEAIARGAYDFVSKPVDLAQLRLALARALERRRLEVENRALRRREVDGEPERIVGQSPQMIELMKQAARVAPTPATVLVTGETGTGKERVARLVHEYSTRAAGRFVAVNCGALAEGLLESELFGHVKGAFTGAIADRPGRFELAGKGTLFLDEIAEIPLELQAKLLRVVQERTFERVGDARPIALEARIVAATHRDLPAMVARGAFREDLFYRLRVVEIALPALRERAGDIPILVEGLLAKINRDLGKDVRYVTPAALARLSAHSWPGNVRELENMLTRAVVLAKTDVLDETLLPIGAAALAGDPAASTGEADADGALPTLREIERRHILRVLAHTEWNKRRACAVLDISRPTLDRKIEEYGLRREEPA